MLWEGTYHMGSVRPKLLDQSRREGQLQTESECFRASNCFYFYANGSFVREFAVFGWRAWSGIGQMGSEIQSELQEEPCPRFLASVFAKSPPRRPSRTT